MKTISLNGKEFILKYTLRAFFVFESISGYAFQFGKMLDEFLLFYSFLLAANQESFKMEFEEFIELCDSKNLSWMKSSYVRKWQEMT